MNENTASDLLKPRCMVAEDYPENPFEIGMILIQDKDTVGEVWVLESEVGLIKQDRNFFYGDILKYPKIFKPLHWWQERNIIDLPDYIKWTSPGQDLISFFKVNNWYSSPNSSDIIGCYVADYGRLFIKDCQPANKEEYDQYIKQQSK